MYNSLQYTVIVHYRAVRLHKIVYEAMMRLAWKGFLLWIHVNHGTEVHHLEEALKSISTFNDKVSQTSITALMDDASCTRMLLLFQWYLGAIGNGNRWQLYGCLPWYGWDNAWLASCNKRGTFAAPSRISPCHDPMVLRLWQGALWTFPVILLCHNVTPSHW